MPNILDFKYILAVAASLFVALLIYVSPIVASVFIAMLIYCSLFTVYPKRTLFIFVIFILFQTTIAKLIGGKSSFLGLMVTYTDEMVLLLSLIVFIFKTLIMRRRFKSYRLVAPLVILIVLGVIGSLAAKVPTKLILESLFVIFKGFTFFFIVANEVFSENDIRKIFSVSKWIALLILFVGVIDVLGVLVLKHPLVNYLPTEIRFGIPSMKSVFSHPGKFGWFCACIALFSFSTYLHSREKKGFLFGALFILGLILSMRLKPIAGFATAAIFMIITMPGRNKVRTVVALFALFLLFGGLFYSQISSLILRQTNQYIFSKDPNKVARTALYITSVNVAKDYFPFGSGLGRYGGTIAADNYSPIYAKYSLNRVWGLNEGQNYLTDTFWPMILGEFGVFGLLVYLYVLFKMFRYCWSSYKYAHFAPLEKAFIYGALLMFIEALVESLAEPIFSGPPQVYLFFGILAIVYSLASSKTSLKPIHE